MKKIIKAFRRMKWRNRKNANRSKMNAGFSFVETLAVLAVSAILASQVGAAAFRMVQRARVSAACTQIESFKAALQSYYIDCGAFPTGEQGLRALWEKPDVFPVPASWSGPYTEKKIPADPWGNEYVYRRKGEVYPEDAPESAPFIILSFGSDGIAGGEKDGIDIVSWQ